ncbi:MAG TPA: acetyl ornithine aminotransferase family protein [Planctomycetaceae bacterium]|jgi:4-aminobutyrate aminotransferase|nr:acetyl ornithine aminotransferase family protein [Planctomycetaceae bacterium]
MLDVNREFAVPWIRTELPGPVARECIARDERVTSPSYTRVYPLVVSRAEGAVIEDVDGNRFLDFNAGIAVCSTGHCHPRVVEAIHRQSSQLLHMSGTDFYYRSQFELAEKLTQITPGTFAKKVFFTNSGTEAIEAAFKLARYHTKRQQMIAFLGAFHGRTMGSLSLTASKVTQRRGFGPLVPGVTHTGYANCRECPQHLTYGNCGIECVATIEKNLFHRLMAPDEVAAIFVEPVQGEGGYIVPPPEFHRDLKALTEKHGILFVADEVQSGMGRTGRMCAIEHWNVVPDIICLAKGIASGLPLGAIVARADIMDWPPGAHASTFGGNPVACAAALETIALIQEGLMENATRQGDFLMDRLKAMQARRPEIGDVRGKGLMIGVELVKPGTTQEPAPDAAEQLVQTCFQKGLLLLRCGVSSVRLCPPLVITREQAETALALIEEALVDMEKGDVHRTRGVPTPTESKQA